MTEHEWLACTDPEPMLRFLRGKVSDRKFRLFACACCRRVWHLLRHQVEKNGVEIAERFADGAATQAELDEAHEWLDSGDYRYFSPYEATDTQNRGEDVAQQTAQAAVDEVGTSVCRKIDSLADSFLEKIHAAEAAERREQSNLIRCVFGNPFRSMPLNPPWLTPHVKQLAEASYQERAFDLLPFLADALEDAGCSSEDILNHCRQQGEHVRGCWSLDLILGKE